LTYEYQNESYLIGTWDVTNVELSDQFEYDARTEAQLGQIAQALIGSSLELTRKGKAVFNTKVPQLYVDRARWSYNPDEGSLKLTDYRNEQDVIMEFLIAPSAGKTLFYISESPFVMEMKKVNTE
jgi:hypothetical protein